MQISRQALLFDHFRCWKRLFLAENQYPLLMRKISTDVLLEYQIGQDALHLVQIDRHAKPLEALCDAIQSDLLLSDYFVNSLEKITITYHFALLKKQVGAPSAMIQVRKRVMGDSSQKVYHDLDLC
jgi:hypothetical protein